MILEEVTFKATHITTLEELKKKLSSGLPLRVKYGIDPTNPNIHLGHTVPLRLLRKFQEAGHIAVIIFGDFTASLGDPSGRDAMRTSTTDIVTARKNSVLFKEQLKKFLLPNIWSEQYQNSDWLEHLKSRDWINLLKSWTIQQMTERDDFKNRIVSGNAVHLSEMLYPIMQGYDSVKVNADIELGGSEQLWTLNIAREMQKMYGQEPQVCITLPILRGIDGKKRMGKSLGNFIGVNEEPFEQFSKTMSIPDDLMPEWFSLLTDRTNIPELIEGVGPMAAKKMLAHDIVTWLHNKEEADKAHDKWHKQFTMRDTPDEIREVKIDVHESPLFLLLTRSGLTDSKSNARRLVSQGAVSVNNEKVNDPNAIVAIKGAVIRCGRQFVRFANDLHHHTIG
jgi:tyrosyl-tRNA synthetase